MVIEVRPLKTPLKIAAGLLALAVLGWTGVFLYWHVRITRAIRTIEKIPSQLHVQGPNPELIAFLFLMRSGCRILPYCVRAIDESNDPIFNFETIGLIRSAIRRSRRIKDPLVGDAEEMEEDIQADDDFLRTCELKEKDTPEMRKLRCRRLHEWWNEKGSKYHQWWRVWSPSCRP